MTKICVECKYCVFRSASRNLTDVDSLERKYVCNNENTKTIDVITGEISEDECFNVRLDARRCGFSGELFEQRDDLE